MELFGNMDWRASIQEGTDLEDLGFPLFAYHPTHLPDFMEGVNFNSTSEKRRAHLETLYLYSMMGNDKFLYVLHSQPGIRINGPAAMAASVKASRGEKEMEAVQQLLLHPAIDINQCDEDGCTALQKIAQHWREGRELAFQVFLQRQELQVNAVHSTLGSALSIACLCNRRKLVQLLLDDPRIDINAAKENGRTSLVCAVHGLGFDSTQHSSALDLLLAHTTKTGIRFTNDHLSRGWQVATNKNLPDIAARIAKHDKLRFRCSFELLSFLLLFDINLLLFQWLLWPPLKAYVLLRVFGSSS